jgi:hypothetical protein
LASITLKRSETMPGNPFSQNNNETYNNPYTPGGNENNPFAPDGYENNPYTPGGNEKSKLRLIVIAVAVFVLVCIGVIAIVTHSSKPNSQQDKNTQSATAAARKKNPNANVSNVKVADGFAISTVQDPTADSQASAGNLTIFKVNKDGSMTQIAMGSSFSPIDLLGLGIPLATQAKLFGQDLSQTEQNLANTCGYDGSGAPGYIGFDGSFDPGGWQIDATTLDNIEQALTGVLSNANAAAQQGKTVVCVNATRTNSNRSTDTTTYISTFTLDLQFITADGTISTHVFTFAIGPHYYRSYTLDGQKIQTT